MHVLTPYKLKTSHGIVYSSHKETKESKKSYEAYYNEMIKPMKILLAQIDSKSLKTKSKSKIQK